MSFVRDSSVFVFLLALHVELLYVFATSYYLFYFINMFFALYIINKYIQNYSKILLALHVGIVLLVINLDIYDELLFEIFLHFDLLNKVIYVNTEIIYALSIIHLLLLINLKRLVEFLGYNKVKVI